MDLSFLTDILTWVAYFVGFARLVMKPIMGVIEEYIRETETPIDDGVYDSIVESAVWKWIVWLVDYLASIKLPETKKAVVKAMSK